MNAIGTVSATDTVAGQPVVEVAVDQVAAGYAVGPCEVAVHVGALTVGARVLVVPVGLGDAQWVVVAALP